MQQDRAAGSPAPADEAGPGPHGLWRRAAFAMGLIALAVFGYFQIDDYLLGRELVAESADKIPAIPRLVNFATETGKTAFAANCASCHGADLKGSQAKGVPDLTDDDWLYDYGRISDIERTVLYGIRAGNGKTHNVTDMPAIGRQKALSLDEVNDVVAYVLTLTKREADLAAAERGSKLFQDKGVCYDCHSRDATGISDYGAPNLADNIWMYGGDAKAIFKSVYDGRHGLCPAWSGKLSYPTIRAIAVYVHAMSKESAASPSRTVADTARGKPG